MYVFEVEDTVVWYVYSTLRAIIREQESLVVVEHLQR